MSGAPGSITKSLLGQRRINTFDYSQYAGDVTVNLPLHLAGLVNQMTPNSIFSIQSVIGGVGNNILVGDANPNRLAGGSGRNLIIGGAGSDTVTGGGDDNILIGGATIWDSNMTAIQAIMQEWTNPNLTFNARVNALRRGIVVNNVTYALNRNTVSADSSPDSLIGGRGQNWFFFDFDDLINNGAGPGANDRVTHV
jgi:Ca2+-binding RTX toxin-like protein